MPASDDDDFGYTYGGHDEPATEERGGPIPAGTSAMPATGDLDGALKSLERAEDLYDAAQGALADLEGRIAVLEIKSDAIEADESKEEWRKAAAREDVAKAKRAFDRAGNKLLRAEAALERAGERVEAEKKALSSIVVTVEEEPEPPQPRFATVDLFVEQFVLPNWVHRYVDKHVRWCETWWEHAEAITRFEAMWEAFEVMRTQPAPSYSTWIRDHFDVHMRSLTDPEGVFHLCDYKEKAHRVGPAWTAVTPEGMFATIETAQIQRAIVEAAAAAPTDTPPPSGPVNDPTRAARDITKHNHTATPGGR